MSDGPPFGPIEGAFAKALERASAVGRWDLVAQLARELEARPVEHAASVGAAAEQPEKSARS